MTGHYVPEGWDELDVGICPNCGQAVSWNEEREEWVPDTSLTVLVLTEDEMNTIRNVALGLPGFKKSKAYRAIESMYDLSRPFEEAVND